MYIEEDLSQLPSAWEYPHLIALLIVIMVITAFTAIWAARRRGELKGESNLFHWVIFLIIVFLQVSIVYFIPAFLIVGLVKYYLVKVNLSPITFLGEYVNPATKIAVFFCVAANFADIMNNGRKVEFKTHGFQLLFFCIPAYYATIGISWLLSLILTSLGNFELSKIISAELLFDIPLLVPVYLHNAFILSAIVLTIMVISFFKRNPKKRI